ncbi:hypothetical protein [Klebsiella huaxiensis]
MESLFSRQRVISSIIAVIIILRP